MNRSLGAGMALLGFALTSAAGADLKQAVEKYVSENQSPIVQELVALLSIPNVAADRPNIRRNAELLERMLARRGLRSELLETAGNPLVYGERKVAGAARTLLFYIHYDGQPIDPPQWKQQSPFHPVLRSGRLEEGAREIADLQGIRKFEPDWRIYARSASDDKSPIVALCAALDALKASGSEPTSNIRVVLDGEEEAGSQSLTAAIGKYRDRFQADMLLILDGPTHPSGRPTLAFGARGVVTLDLKVYGPKFPLHSGHYGNWVPNPAVRMAQLLASMKDDRGRALVPGFYDDIPPLTSEERRILGAVPDDLDGLARLFGMSQPDGVAATLQEALQFPSLNIRGLNSAFVGADARTIIPSDATAAIDIRLVKETPAARMVERVLSHIRNQGYHVVDRDPDDDVRLKFPRIVRATWREPTEAYRTEMDLPQSVALSDALKRVWGLEPVRLRTMGGTVPISQFIRALGCPAVSVPTVNFDNNQHAENENLRLGHFWNAIVTIAAVLRM